MSCRSNSDISNVLCNYWHLTEFCGSTELPAFFKFKAKVPKSEIDLFNNTVVFGISNIIQDNGTVLTDMCPSGNNISSLCSIECGDYSINEVVTNPAFDDEEVYVSYQFWNFLILMVIGWIGQAVAVSVGDAICFELLGMILFLFYLKYFFL